VSVLVIRLYKANKYLFSIVITYKGPKFIQHLAYANFMLQQVRTSEKAHLILFKIGQYSESRVYFFLTLCWCISCITLW